MLNFLRYLQLPKDASEMTKSDFIDIINETSSIYAESFSKPSNFRFVGDSLYCIKNDSDFRSTVMKVDKGSFFSVIPKQLNTKRELSIEEKLLKQRKRELRDGVSSFTVTKIDGIDYVTFSIGDAVYLYEDKEKKLKDVSGSSGKIKLDKKFSKDGYFYAFIHKNEINLQRTLGDKTVVLTQGANKEKHITNGIAEYIIEEEFDRTTGYWICPEKTKQGNYRIMYFMVNSSQVPITKVSCAGDSREFNSYYYPRPGERNAESFLKTIEFDKDFNIVKLVDHSILQNEFKWSEYVVDAGWFSLNKIFLKLIDRRQKHFVIALYDIESKKSIILVEEKDEEYYINVSPVLFFFKDKKRYIYGSEKDGFHHLYLNEIKNDGKTGSPTQLTNGSWIVDLKQNIKVDEDEEIIYFQGRKDSHLQNNLYSVDLKEKKIKRILPKGFHHQDICISENFSKIYSCFSNLENPPTGSIFIKDKEKNSYKFDLNVYKKELNQFTKERISQPSIFNFKSKLTNSIIYGIVYPPSREIMEHELKKNPKKKFPAVLYVYGGPHVQYVTDSFINTVNPRVQRLTKMGYFVIKVDSEGSYNRGKIFERHIYKKMGQIELETQIEGIKKLIDEKDYPIDEKRIGIIGFSYGGYLSLIGISKHGNFFKCSYAGSSVVDWKLYDNAYTERYMDLPEYNKEGYKKGSVLNYLNEFPNEDNRLLISSGMQDENVFFKNTETLISHLIQNDKPYCLKVYPSERHMFVNPKARIRETIEHMTFFGKNL